MKTRILRDHPKNSLFFLVLLTDLRQRKISVNSLATPESSFNYDQVVRNFAWNSRVFFGEDQGVDLI